MCRWGDKPGCNGLKRDFGKWRQSIYNISQLSDGQGGWSAGSDAGGRRRVKAGFHNAEKSGLLLFF